MSAVEGLGQAVEFGSDKVLKEVRPSLLGLWYLPLLAGLLPVLVGGFVASAVANRVAFAVWAVAVGAAYTALLRIGIERGWEWHARAAAMTGLLAVAFAAFAGLVGRHREIFELGWRAVFGVEWAVVATRPGTWLGMAGLLAVVAVWQLGAWRAIVRQRATGGEAAA